MPSRACYDLFLINNLRGVFQGALHLLGFEVRIGGQDAFQSIAPRQPTS